MREFAEAKLQVIALDFDTDEKYTLTLGKLVEDADVTAIKDISKGLNSLIDGQVIHARVVESHVVLI